MRVVVVLAVASALLSSTVSGLKTHTDPDSYDSVAEARKAAEEGEAGKQFFFSVCHCFCCIVLQRQPSVPFLPIKFGA